MACSDTQPRAILTESVSWWTAFAWGIARANPDWPEETIAGAARQALQHLVFLRMAELRRLDSGISITKLGSQGRIAERVGEQLSAVAERLGWGLFRLVQSDDASAASGGDGSFLSLDDAVLHPILTGICRRITANDPACSAPALLGQVHERLMGRSICRDAAGGLKSITGTGARKSAGLFYTPDCVADYIATLVVGQIAENQPHFGDLRLIDPACGGGAFLLAACRALHRQARTIGQESSPQDLIRALYGMELDPEALLAARRTLFLEAADLSADVSGGNHSPTASFLRPIAAILERNLRCGDALANAARQAPAGPCDAVLGNPPYRRELDAKPLLDRIAATELGRRHRAARMDLWHYFLHRGLEWLRPGGVLSFIVNAYWTAGRSAQNLIRVLQKSCHIDEVFLLEQLQVFSGVSGRHMILSLTKGRGSGPTRIKRPAEPGLKHAEPFLRGDAPVTVCCKSPEQLFCDGRLDLEPPAMDFGARARCVPLAALGHIRQGIAENPAAVNAKTNKRHGDRWRVGEGVFALRREELEGLGLSKEEQSLLRPYHDLRDLGRYVLAWQASLLLIYSTSQTCPDINRFPAIRTHLERFRPILDARRETRLGTRAWWQLHWPREETLWLRPKIVALQMAPRPAFVPATTPVYVPFSANVFVPHDETKEHLNYLAAVLNSRLMEQWFRRHAKRRGVGLEINGHVLGQAPMRRIDFADRADRARHDRLVELVDAMLVLTRRLREALPSLETETLQQQRAETDREIDGLVEELYEAPG